MFEVFLTAIESDDRFSHLKRAIIQADNAACYHDKSFVFGIAFLNKMQNRKIRIDQKIHTEMQDRKSLVLDAHFARGTKQVVKYLKTSGAAENKRVGSPVELAKALAWNGGIQNSVVLLIEVDREKRLPAFNDVIQGCSDKALEYFSRANEIEFLEETKASKVDLTDEASWGSFSFDIRVWVHSGIGAGARFRCNVGIGECLHIEGDFEELLNHKSSKDGSDRDKFEDNEPIGDEFVSDDLEAFEDTDSDADDEELLDDVYACYFDDIEEWQTNNFGDTDPLSPPTFSLNNSLSGVKIIGMSSFGALNAKVLASEDNEELPINGVHDYGIQNPSRAALPRALHMVDYLAANNSIKISGGNNDDLEVYKLANNFALDETQFEKGWAWRPLKGTFYGESNMNAQYKAEIYDWVKKENENKSNKLNPRQMHLRLKADHKCFAVPSEQEIRTVIGPMLQQLKEQSKKQSKNKQSKNKQWKKQSNDENQEEKQDEQSRDKNQQEEQDYPYTAKALEWCSGYLKQKVHQVGWEQMKPKTVVERMWNLLYIDWPKKKFRKMEYNKRFSALKSARKKRHENVRKKAFV
jgi:hypothetical protein